MNFTEKQLEKAKQAKSAEELLAFAKENGMELTAKDAAKYFAEWHKEGELADDELDNVAGGTKEYENYGNESIEGYDILKNDPTTADEKPIYQYDPSVCRIRNLLVEPCPFSDDYRRLRGAELNCNGCPRNPQKHA